ncbi:endonuclease/exonuclease/phosphatase family protein [Desulfobacterales bacterium HSG17]|nr:endonuclease/exonuclease/phosphatase family protein [Desulfobacterales bacterium HSG17]
MMSMITCLTLNIRFGLADDGPNSWNYRKAAIGPLLEEFSADFFAFQETNGFQIDYLREILPDHQFIGQRSPAPPFWQNNIIFYHNSWELKDWHHIFLSHVPSLPSRFAISRWPRQCTMAIFEKKNQKVCCLSTHFDFNEDVQVKSAKIILRCLQKFCPDLPILIMGDFNTVPLSSCHNVFTGAGAFRHTFTPPFPNTHHGFGKKCEGGHIDWILYKGRLKTKTALVVQKKYEGYFPSDHYPVYVSFNCK